MIRGLRGGRLVLASHNAGKLRELAALLAPYGVTVVPAGDFGLAEPAETGSSFAGNAQIKARAAAIATGLPALADDSGLEVDALDGAPGVRSADWATTGAGRDYGAAMTRLAARLDAVAAPEPRLAAFRTVLCLSFPDGTGGIGEEKLYDGRVSGRLVWPPRGEQGFGYDPMFVPDGAEETFGEMDPADKAHQSHRADAFRRLARDLE